MLARYANGSMALSLQVSISEAMVAQFSAPTSCPAKRAFFRLSATGRKSWLFSDTVDGAKASAVIYSLMLTCRACGVDPLTWLRHVLTELPQREEAADIGDLLPFNLS